MEGRVGKEGGNGLIGRIVAGLVTVRIFSDNSVSRILFDRLKNQNAE